MQLWRILFLLFVAFLGDATPSAAAEMAENDADVEGQVAQGIALRRSGNDEAALAVFLDLEKRDPDSVRVLLHISTAALAAGRWLLAYDYLQKASLHKDDPYYQRHRVSIENVERTIAERVGQFRARGTPAGAVVRLSGEVIGALPMDSVKAIEVVTPAA